MPMNSHSNQAPVLVYDALPNDTSIRVLNITGSGPQISCKMSVVDLAHDPEYIALSYTWGDPITIRETAMPDLSAIPESESDRLPFAYMAQLDAEGHALCRYDVLKRDYYATGLVGIPHEGIGRSEGMRCIQVNDIDVEVTENLYYFLEQVLSWRLNENHARIPISYLFSPIWIDALCINQNDLNERATQVQLMDRVFKSAMAVLGWLGPRDNFSDLGYRAILRLLEFQLLNPNASGSDMAPAQVSFEPLDQSLWSLWTIPGIEVVHWFGLFCFLQRSWFHRAWIAQEVVYSKDLYLMYGDSYIFHMDILATVTSFLAKHGLDREMSKLGKDMLTGQPLSHVCQALKRMSTFSARSCNPHESWAPKISTLEVDPSGGQAFIMEQHRVRGRLGLSKQTILEAKRLPDEVAAERQMSWYIKSYEVIPLYDKRIDRLYDDRLQSYGYKFHLLPLTLLSTLHSFRQLDASDPRDKVFAFLSLAQEKFGIIPNYHATVQDVFVEATKAILEKTHSLEILSHMEDLTETVTPHLPRWVPDFSARPARKILAREDRSNPFNASSMTKYLGLTFEDDGALRLKGYMIDSVVSVANLQNETVMDVLKLILHLPARYRAARPLYPLEECQTRVEALRNTLIADEMERKASHYSLRGDVSLTSGFVQWIITDLAEAFCAYLDYGDSSYEPVAKLSANYLRDKLSVWLAVYDGNRSDQTITSDATLTELFKELSSRVNDENSDCHFFLDEKEEEAFQSFPSAFQLHGVFQELTQMQRNFDNEEGAERPCIYEYLHRQMSKIRQRNLREFEKLMRRNCEGRVLFRTRSNLLGLGPLSTTHDSDQADQVWILAGARVPFILRPERDGRFKIIGEAFVHGMMDDSVGNQTWHDVCLI